MRLGCVALLFGLVGLLNVVSVCMWFLLGSGGVVILLFHASCVACYLIVLFYLGSLCFKF